MHVFCIHRIKDIPPFKFMKIPRLGNKFFNQKKLAYILLSFLIVVFVLSVAFNVYQWVFAGRVYLGVALGPYNLGGKTQEEVEKFLHEEIDKFLSQGFAFKALNESAVIPAYITSLKSLDIVYSLADYDFDKMVKEVFWYGKSGSAILNVKDIIRAMVFGKRFEPEVLVSGGLVLAALQEKFGHLEKKPQNAGVDISFRGDETVIGLISDRNGTVFDYDAAIKQLGKNLSEFKIQEITIVPSGVSADIKLNEVSVFAPSIAKIFNGNSFQILFTPFDTPPIPRQVGEQGAQGGLVWDLPKETLARWITFKRESGAARLGLDAEKIKQFIEEKKIPAMIEIETKNAKFVYKDDKVVEFQASTTGKKINYDLTAKSFERFFFGADKNGIVTAEIVVDIQEPQIITGQANTLGIEEKISEGKTNFTDSPKNRIHNIKNGASIIDGLIIQSGEMFSLNSALGEVSQATGFKAELVIKGDKTTPEFGGGLCQIATTLFRAAMNAGLPIIARTNHSYRVSYYEPPVGMDATVYNPSPDLKFINDTQAPILIQSKIEGVNLTFEFWGKKDGRTVEMSMPVIFNITQPEPTKIVETTELKPGEKKCTEKPHKGADAYFDYKVTYPNGEVKEKRFKSHYRAWREVCLVGVAATSTPSGL